MNATLHDLRLQLNHLDDRLLSLLQERCHLVDQVGQAKSIGTEPLRDPAREDDILTRLVDSARRQGIDTELVRSVYHKLFEHAARRQSYAFSERAISRSAPVIGFMGELGSYGSEAAARFFAAEPVIETIGYPDFASMLEAVRAGTLDRALLPIENSTAGSIDEAYDLLAKYDLALVGEELLRVEHRLCALSQVPLESLRTIRSHPKALEQCREFLSRMSHCRIESAIDTATAARQVRDSGDPTEAAIAGDAAIERFGLVTLSREVSDQCENFTRFVVVARSPVVVNLRVPAKTSIVFTARHEPGSLTKCLEVLARRKIDLTKLESRPRAHAPWEYRFFVDFEGNLAEPRVHEAIDELARETGTLKLFGSYPAKTFTVRPEREPIMETKSAPKLVTRSASKPFKAAARQEGMGDSIFQVRGAKVGGSIPILIAGPCSVESREQIFSCAAVVKESGATMLRGGCFKPRSSPYAFQGLGWEGIELLAEAGRAFDLPIVTEVMNSDDLERVAKYVDVIQIGARNMQNFSLLKALGRIDRPVILKRGLMATIEEWLQAAEYILAHGNQQVILCERGIRTFETATRNTLDLSAVPVVREWSHLPVIVDPSHACGVRRWVAPLTEAALAVGAQGVMVEMHPEPEKALSDGAQSLDFSSYQGLADKWRSRVFRS